MEIKRKLLIPFLVLIVAFFSIFMRNDSNGKDGVPGVVISHLPSSSGKYVGSPSLLVLDDGTYLASHDTFGPQANPPETYIFHSVDQGKTWERIAVLKNQFWSNLFQLNGNIYLMGTTKEYGKVIIRKSEDGGITWTTPVNTSNGILLNEDMYHTSAVPIAVYKGRIWRAVERRDPPEGWGTTFKSFVMSASINSDLLKAESWTTTNMLAYDPEWPGTAWLEGNVVESPYGYLWNILRNHTKEGNKAAVIKIGLTGKVVTFDPATGFINFPGGSVKFTIRYDEQSDKYYSLTNYVSPKYKDLQPDMVRNTLALISSTDLIHWNIEKVILNHPDVKRIGFQYADFRFSKNDIIFVSRTAFYDDTGGPPNYHDSNFLTFHKINNFRTNPELDTAYK